MFRYIYIGEKIVKYLVASINLFLWPWAWGYRLYIHASTNGRLRQPNTDFPLGSRIKKVRLACSIDWRSFVSIVRDSLIFRLAMETLNSCHLQVVLEEGRHPKRELTASESHTPTTNYHKATKKVCREVDAVCLGENILITQPASQSHSFYRHSSGIIGRFSGAVTTAIDYGQLKKWSMRDVSRCDPMPRSQMAASESEI